MITVDPGSADFYFVPEDGAAYQVAYRGVAATENVELCVGAYALTDAPLVAQIIANAKRPGLAQFVLVDKSQTLDPIQLAAVKSIIAAGVQTLVGTTQYDEILHSKYLLGKATSTVVTGSYNFSKSAATQDNIATVFRSEELWTAARAHFQAEWDQVKANDSQAWLA